jgi:hypothetical protein
MQNHHLPLTGESMRKKTTTTTTTKPSADNVVVAEDCTNG